MKKKNFNISDEMNEEVSYNYQLLDLFEKSSKNHFASFHVSYLQVPKRRRKQYAMNCLN